MRRIRLNRAAVTAAAGLLAAQTASAVEITRGPVLSRPTADGIVVTFELDAPAVPTLRWGTEGALDDAWTAEGSGDVFEVALVGLPAGSTVDYRIYVADEPISEPATIPTAVEPGTPFSFIVFGDSRSRPDVHQAIVDAMDAVPDVRWYVQTGDLVSDGEILEQWDEYFAIERAMMATTPIFPVIGNHDEHDGSAAHFVNLFANPENSPQPEHYYSFDYGNVHATVLDGHVNAMTWLECFPERGLLVDDCFTIEQEAWLLADLEAAAVDPDIDHILVFTHIGPYSSKDGRSGSAQMRLLLPQLHELGVTAIVSGHDHYYERGIADLGIPYVITGGGGAPLYEVADPSSAPHEVVINASIEHWLEIHVDGVHMDVVTRTLDGGTLDSFSIDATPECSADTDCSDAEPDLPCDTYDTRCSLGGRCIATCVEEGDDSDADAGDADTGSEVDADDVALPDAEPDVPLDTGGETDVPTPSDTSEEEGEGTGSAGRGRGGCTASPVRTDPSGLVLAVLLGIGAARRRTRPA